MSTGDVLSLYRDGCTPSFDEDVRLSTSLCVPEERLQLHVAIRTASESIVGQLDSSAPSMQRSDAFEMACQSFEPCKFPYVVDSSQALAVRVYRTLNRRINSKIVGDEYEDVVVHNSTRSMWKEFYLTKAIEMVEEEKMNLLASLQAWKESEDSSNPSIFDGYDYKRM